jgi:hypothetical protein
MHSSDPRQRVALLSMLLVLTLVVVGTAGCATSPPVPPVTGADVSLLQACEEPAGSAQTNGAMAEWLRALRDALRACNDQIATFKESAK